MISSLLCHVLSFFYHLTCWICLLFQGPQGIRGAMGMMGSKGEMVSGCTISMQAHNAFYTHKVLSSITCQYRVNHINIYLLRKCLFFKMFVLWQGARGPDGDPGPQGVAGATVSLSNNVDVIVFATNAG